MVNYNYTLDPSHQYMNTSFIQFLFGFVWKKTITFLVLVVVVVVIVFLNIYFPLLNFKFIFALSFVEFIHKFVVVFCIPFEYIDSNSTLTSYDRTTTLSI